MHSIRLRRLFYHRQSVVRAPRVPMANTSTVESHYQTTLCLAWTKRNVQRSPVFVVKVWKPTLTSRRFLLPKPRILLEKKRQKGILLEMKRILPEMKRIPLEMKEILPKMMKKQSLSTRPEMMGHQINLPPSFRRAATLRKTSHVLRYQPTIK